MATCGIYENDIIVDTVVGECADCVEYNRLGPFYVNFSVPSIHLRSIVRTANGYLT